MVQSLRELESVRRGRLWSELGWGEFSVDGVGVGAATSATCHRPSSKPPPTMANELTNNSTLHTFQGVSSPNR